MSFSEYPAKRFMFVGNPSIKRFKERLTLVWFAEEVSKQGLG